ncbi:MAG: phosphate regulon transcriptional regulator PhoB [Burkholderiales bacterium]|jgi:two-component system phosphate regulon response regulator PhoB
MSRILVVEDEFAIAELIAINLRHAGHDVVMAHNALLAEAEIDRILPDLVLLDWMLPGQSGIMLARSWRAQQRTRELPLIILTARTREEDKIMGLDAGADDYLTKPFSPSELLARIRAVLRRRSPESLDVPLEVSGLHLEPSTRRVYRAGVDVKMGPTEFKLLYFFLAHPGRIHSRSHLLNRVWGDHVFIEDRTIDVHVKRLREALDKVGCARLIETVRGAGYRLAPMPAANES